MTRPELPTAHVRVVLGDRNGKLWHVVLEEHCPGGPPKKTSLNVRAVMFEVPAWTVDDKIVGLGHVAWSGFGLSLKVST